MVKETTLVCDKSCCGGHTFNIIRTYDEKTDKMTHRIVCAECGEQVDDMSGILPEFDVTLQYITRVKGKDHSDAIKNAQNELGKYPQSTTVVSCVLRLDVLSGE